MTGPSEEQLREWQRLADEATPGPWSAADEHGLLGPDASPAWCVSQMRPGYESMSPTEGYIGDVAETSLGGRNAMDEPNAAFIAAAREAVPALLADRAALAARLAEVEGEVERWRSAFHQAGADASGALDRAEQAEAAVVRVEALADEFDTVVGFRGAATSLRAALRGEVEEE